MSLDKNTTADRSVDFQTTIPGTVGITGGHYDTTFGEIWSVSGPAPATGTVTLIISAGTDEEFRTSKSIQSAENCPQPTETPAPTVTPTPTPTDTPAPTDTTAPTGTPEQTVAPTQTPAPTRSPEQAVQAGTGTPAPQVPNTSIETGSSGSLLLVAFGFLLIASLAGLAFRYAEVVRSR